MKKPANIPLSGIGPGKGIRALLAERDKRHIKRPEHRSRQLVMALQYERHGHEKAQRHW